MRGENGPVRSPISRQRNRVLLLFGCPELLLMTGEERILERLDLRVVDILSYSEFNLNYSLRLRPQKRRNAGPGRKHESPPSGEEKIN